MSHTEMLADLLAGFDGDISEDVIEHTKFYLLDNMGCAIE